MPEGPFCQIRAQLVLAFTLYLSRNSATSNTYMTDTQATPSTVGTAGIAECEVGITNVSFHRGNLMNDLLSLYEANPNFS